VNLCVPCLVALLLYLGQAGWQANPQTVRDTAAKQAAFNYEEARVPAYTLPDLFPGAGATIRTPDDWRTRRADLLDLFRDNVYGRSPGKPTRLRFEPSASEPAMGGAATLKRVAIISEHNERQHRFDLTLFLPNARREPAPVFLLLNNRPASNTDPTRRELSDFWPAEQVIARGYAIAAIQVSDLAPDDKDRYRDGAIRLFEDDSAARPDTAWAALAAWAWGASRAMDYFETDSGVDAKRVAVVGHSRGGKAALWAGAEDERFALIVSNESGEGGAALTRRHFGETLARITETFPHWFAGKYTSFSGRIDALPIDQHMLLALMAPRAIYIASADEDLWSDPRGEFLSLVHASPVFALWGDRPLGAEEMPPLDRPLVAQRRGYHVRRGGHNLTRYDWQSFMDFADTLWK
jgi:dienelactone hydrolase